MNSCRLKPKAREAYRQHIEFMSDETEVGGRADKLDMEPHTQGTKHALELNRKEWNKWWHNYLRYTRYPLQVAHTRGESTLRSMMVSLMVKMWLGARAI